MNFRSILAIPMAVSVVVVAAYPGFASKSEAVDTVQSATKVFASIATDSKIRIPAKVLSQSQAIAIIPHVVKAGFIVGGSRGKGILMQRNDNGTWSNPVFLTLTSGSVGLQVGGQSSDLILVFRNKSSIDTILTNEFTLGGSVSVAAGPVGGDAVSSNDGQPDTDIYTYAANEGLFAGISLEGAKIAVDRMRNQDYYGQLHITVQQILINSGLAIAPETAELHRVLNQVITTSLQEQGAS
jgi:lipid-binding SYLF domain-containing protein